MPYFEVIRSVSVDQVVLIEAEDEEEAREKGWNRDGKVQHEEVVEVTHVTDVRS